MKFRTMVRMQMILMGLGAALLLASSAHAQQDMDPTTFPDSGNVEPFRQPAAVTVNNAIAFTDPANAATTQQAISTEASDKRAAAQEGSVAKWTTADAWGVSLLLISMTLVTLYRLARAKNERTEGRSAISALFGGNTCLAKKSSVISTWHSRSYLPTESATGNARE